jgi:hypothetical protein
MNDIDEKISTYIATGLKYDTNIKFMKSSNCLHCCVDPREKNSIATEKVETVWNSVTWPSNEAFWRTRNNNECSLPSERRVYEKLTITK